MRKSIHFLLAKVPHIDVPPELRAHNLAVKFPLPGVEQGLINILVGMAQFAEGHSIKFDATITKDGVLGPVWVTMAQIRGTPLARSSGLRDVEEASSTTAIPYTVTYRKDYPFISNANDLQSWAEYLAENFNAVQPLISVKTYARKSTGLMANIVQSDIGTKLTITDNAFAWSSHVNEDYFVDAIRIEVDAKSTPKVDYVMSKSFNESYWILGTSELDTGTILGW